MAGRERGGGRRLARALAWLPALGALALAWWLLQDLLHGEEGLEHNDRLRTELAQEVQRLQETTAHISDAERKAAILRDNPEAMEEQVRMRIGAVREGEVLILPQSDDGHLGAAGEEPRP